MAGGATRSPSTGRWAARFCAVIRLALLFLSPRPPQGGEGQGEGELRTGRSLPPSPQPSPPFGGRGGSLMRGAHAGFTLIEILVSLAILGIILATFAQVVSSSLLSSRRVDAETEILLFGRSTMERLGRDLPLRPGSTQGSFAGSGRWHLRIAPADVTGRSAATLTTFLVELTVGKPPVSPITLTTLRAVPVAAPQP